MMFLRASGELFIPTTATVVAGMQCAGHHGDARAQPGPTLAFQGPISTLLSLECPLEEPDTELAVVEGPYFWHCWAHPEGRCCAPRTAHEPHNASTGFALSISAPRARERA